MAYPLTPASGHEDEDRRHRTLRSATGTRHRTAMAVTLFTQPRADVLHDWDQLVRQVPGSDVCQLSAWSTLRRQAGFLPLHLLARHDGRLVGGAVILQRQLPVLGVVGYLPYGPLVAVGEPRAAVTRALSTALAELARRQLGSLFVQPPEDAHDLSAQLMALGFRRSTAHIAPEASIVIDLTPDVEDLRNGLTRSNRRRTHTWADRGVVVRVGGGHDLPLVADLLACTASYQNFEPLSLDYLDTLYRELGARGHVKIFIAELDGVAVAAGVFTGCGGVLKWRLTGMRRSEAASRSGVAAAVVWNAIIWAKANGYRTFDFGGIPGQQADRMLADDTSGWTGPIAFKASFGGQPVRYPRPVELISSTLVRLGYDLARRTTLGERCVATARLIMRGGRR